MNIEEEIQAQKREDYKALLNFTEYEIKSSWWAPWVFWNWGQELLADYYLWKTRRKFRRYKFIKLLEDARKEDQRAPGSNPRKEMEDA